MKSTSEHQRNTLFRNLAFLASCLLTISVIGCGSSSSPASPTQPTAGASTKVAIQLSSTANDQFLDFAMEIDTISLTNAAGKTTTIFATPTTVDFIRSNGNASPLATVSIPQDTYTSAAVTVVNPRFSYLMNSQGNPTFSTDGYDYTLPNLVVTLAQPITITSSPLGLTLDLQASPSGILTGLTPPQPTYSINPTFNLRSFAIPAQSTTSQNGKCIGISARVTSIDTAADSITVALPLDSELPSGLPAQSVNVSLNAATQLQGISSLGSLTAGTFVNMDMALQPDASYVATRVEVQDANAANVASGQLVQVDPSSNYIQSTSAQEQGDQLTVLPTGFGLPFVYDSSTRFQISARFPDLGALPFTATFNRATLAAGQNVSAGALSVSDVGGTYTLPSSVTLIPQTIDATVSAVSNSGNYTVYTVNLAPYDPIVQRNSSAVAPANSHLPNANIVNVYVNSSTSLLNTTALAVGQTLRFDGLLFNDTGVLRMVCDQINDGVAQ
jgi:hypothetical protein